MRKKDSPRIVKDANKSQRCSRETEEAKANEVNEEIRQSSIKRVKTANAASQNNVTCEIFIL